MNKERFYTFVAAIGFFGVVFHPVMIIPFAIGVWGLNKYGTADNERA